MCCNGNPGTRCGQSILKKFVAPEILSISYANGLITDILKLNTSIMFNTQDSVGGRTRQNRSRGEQLPGYSEVVDTFNFNKQDATADFHNW